MCVQKASRHLVAGKSFGRSCTHPPTSSNWQRLLQKHIFLLMHTHTEVPEIPGKVSVCIMHRAMDARHAHKALFHMGDARGLAPNSDPHVCKRFRFLRLGVRMHPEVSGRFVNVANSFVFFRSKPVLFLRLWHWQCKVTFPTNLARGALAAACPLRL